MNDYFEIISKSLALRQEYINQKFTNVYRLVNSYGDNIPELTIDVYNKNILLQYFKPFEKKVKESIYTALKEILAPDNISEKIRLKGKEVETYLVIGHEIPRDFTVLENSIKFNISFQEGGGTGLFLDQRENRKKIQYLAKGKEVLNLFCYTTSFSVYAGLGGAVKTVNIDLSKKAIEWSKKNFLLNQLDVDTHEFIVGDAGDWLRIFQKRGREFDIIIIDPPSFSTSKSDVFTVEKDFPELIGHGLNILRKDGILAFSTNLAKMNFSKLFQLLPRVANFTSKKYKLIEVSSQGIDFPVDCIHITEPYLKFIILTC